MIRRTLALAVTLSCLAVPGLVAHPAAAAAKPHAAAAGAPKSPTARAAESAAPSPLDPLKKLAGTWAGQAGHGDQKMDVQVTYKVTANGSAVMETICPGTPHEMVTMYTVDGDRVALTHYCAIGNQPHMRQADSSTPEKLVFEFVPSPGIDPEKDTHMHAAVIQLVDARHIRSRWTSYEGGKEASAAEFELKRRK
jgi:hypothetical protein